MLGPAEMKAIWEEFDHREAEEKARGGNRPQRSAMINSEKFLKMMDPSKAIEAFNQGNVFDVKAQSKRVESYTDRAFKPVGLCQAETRKPVELCLGQSEAVVKEGQKFVNEWVSTLTQANSELVKDVRDNVKKAAKAFELSKPAKVAKAA